MTGHMLCAAGAAEAAFLLLSLDRRFSDGRLPPHLWDGDADPEIPPIHLAAIGTRLPERTRVAMLSSSFAFGGSNVAVIFGRGWHG
jgi:3-oxoacyl-[acyl-carrier-protein] synthase-1